MFKPKKKAIHILFTILFLFYILPAFFWFCVNPSNTEYSQFPVITKSSLVIGKKLKNDIVADLELIYAKLLMNQKQSFLKEFFIDYPIDPTPGWNNPNTLKMFLRIIKEHPDSYAALEAKLHIAIITESKSHNPDNIKWSNEMYNEIIESFPLSPEGMYSRFLLTNSLLSDSGHRLTKQQLADILIVIDSALKKTQNIDIKTREQTKKYFSEDIYAAMLILKGEALCRTGELEQAKLIYQDIIDKYPGTRSSNYAQININRMNGGHCPFENAK